MCREDFAVWNVAHLTLLVVMSKLLPYAAIGLLLVPCNLVGQRPGGDRRPGNRSINADRMLTRYDINKDGKLTESEVSNQRMWQRIVRADKDEDGSLTKQELQSLGNDRGRSSRSRGGDSAWKFLADKYDTNKDGRITTDEYQRDQDTFLRLDRNKDGALSAEDWTDSSDSKSPGNNRSESRNNRSRNKAPEWGQFAPDFELTFVNDAKKTARLSSYRGKKPVALIFGSCS